MPEDRYLILVVLFLDIANTLIREFIFLVSSDRSAAGIGNVVMFVILGACAVVASPFTLAFTDDRNAITVVVWLVQLAASVAYFYGDNISYIVVNYGDVLGCDEQCAENNRIAAVVMLGIAMLVLNVFPILFGGLEKLLITDKDGSWYYTVDTIAVLLRIDIIFTTIAVMAQTNEFCSLTDRSLGWSMFCICSVFGIAAIIMTCIYAFKRIDKAEHGFNHFGAIVVSVVGVAAFLSLALILYMLADNEQPIDCVWGCDSFASNSTRMDAEISGMSCNEKANSGMRFGLMAVTLFLIIAALSWLGGDVKLES